LDTGALCTMERHERAAGAGTSTLIRRQFLSKKVYWLYSIIQWLEIMEKPFLDMSNKYSTRAFSSDGMRHCSSFEGRLCARYHRGGTSDLAVL
jgi:hypothetical protein